MPNQRVEIVRLYDAHYYVAAWDIFGQLIAERTYRHGSRRREMAISQAEQWAERHYLQFDGTVHN